MNDGTCACGTCHVPAYARALMHAERGLFVLLLNRPDHISLTAYAPTPAEAEVLLYPDERVRAAGHIGLARAIDRDTHPSTS